MYIIVLPQVLELAKETPTTGECVTAGWGTQTVNSLVMTTILQKTLAYLVDKDECNDVDRSKSNKIDS